MVVEAAGLRAGDEDGVLFIARLIAAIAAAPAAEVALGRVPPPKRFEDEEPEVVLEVDTQACVFGKRCEGQNCCLHFYKITGSA